METVDTKEGKFTFHIENSAGCYVMGGNFEFHLDEKPAWIHRYFMKKLTGWVWLDNKQKV